MIEGFRPMLSANADIGALKFPVLVSPKLDGVRCIALDGKLYSRTLKLIPNKALQGLAKTLPDGADGELISGGAVGNEVYRRTVSQVMTRDADASGVRFYIFDRCLHPDDVYTNRMASITEWPAWASCLAQRRATDLSEVLELERRCVKKGYEGVMLRAPWGPYKFGRSTVREGFLLKLKRFEDGEAVVVGFQELMHNDNPAEINELGYTKHSHHQEGKVPAGVLGALLVRDGDMEFSVGTGFDYAERVDIWKNQLRYLGHVVKYKHLPIGQKDVPRHPVFLGWRSTLDMGDPSEQGTR